MLIGKRLNDRYKLLEMIGGGGMANVYLAHDDILGRDVAVKILRLDYANNEEFIKRFHREAQSVTTLSHPNIVNMYDVGEEDGIYYLVMEYVPGQTLKQYINQRGMLSIAEALDIMEQLTAAMAHAHHFEIVHRDIKPHNILIRNDGIVKVTDFGIATATSATTITHTNSVLGSVHYLSPEQARGGIANKQSDIYSLGIVMFELLTGRQPFSGESAVAIALKHLQNETPSPKRWNPEIPQSVENIILKATAKDPFHRYQSANAMKRDIETALYPERINEQPFYIPEDIEATKAIPIIQQEQLFGNAGEETIVLHGNKGEEHTKEEVQPKLEKKRSNKWLKVLITTFLFLAIGITLALTVIPGFFIPKDVKIPDVAGMKYESAVTALVEKGFEVAEPNIVYTDDVEEGRVIKTNPAAGRVVKENTKITIYQSGGKKKSKMDNLVGKDYESLKDEWEGKYKIIIPSYMESEKPKGQIIDQSPAPNQMIVESEQEVKVWVSKGPYQIRLGDFSGWTENYVNSYLNENKLVSHIKREYSDTVEKGLVISQSPKPGTPLKAGDKVFVTISDGPKPKVTKTVKVDNISLPYEAPVIGEKKPQIIEIYKEDMQHKMDKPIETRTITESATISLEFVIQEGTKGRYKIVRDGTTIIDKEVPYPTE
ncbi:Stk1 family PASTA domain-containing Ser/Thr kinase [Bacillus cytotoxicus]|uniref:Stk1 family PASTA domain-containing Ser/Thr kinase n=1 Tax=Bacillus cereus group TaxID=86661 RepID=UPI000B34D60A|nr:MULTISPECIES: Stk1 family PASTA domain-containing Ser/Thr kinase [Bacillus cereus group]QTR78671.1 Stk1 family PASTA domain-containing Ser/Thr kinase [Bacillus cytotoxicus]QTR81530.1 Stk1 family PASTA domain-containing Ser/Thr kinase [Bacillus cytotoxicus]QTR85268.1 Stk1 family PASTA domain-containing Ser/Thr kinase [Bacillus cytotoxicus]HDR4569783.1 Stk1 family PASTA domain-containing Ser/Thr kinase [Bacillus cytotoxicus]HDR4585594.1 Stk1 family PASTA domain-containing Ser/Thr kinase [Baci